MEENVTCGVLFRRILEKFTDGTPRELMLAGTLFAAGQAEKVFSGACLASMARSSPEYYDVTVDNMRFIAQVYGLTVVPLPYLGEIWICRKENASHISAMSELLINSPAWHYARAWLCGIPTEEVDEQFHLRRGYGERTM